MMSQCILCGDILQKQIMATLYEAQAQQADYSLVNLETHDVNKQIHDFCNMT